MAYASYAATSRLAIGRIASKEARSEIFQHLKKDLLPEAASPFTATELELALRGGGQGPSCRNGQTPSGSAPSPSHWVRFLKDWLSQRESKVRLNRALSRPRLFSAGVSQGSPLSPLLFVLSTASLPEAIRSVSPDCAVTLYICGRRHAPGLFPGAGQRGKKMQRALDATETEGSTKPGASAWSCVAGRSPTAGPPSSGWSLTPRPGLPTARKAAWSMERANIL